VTKEGDGFSMTERIESRLDFGEAGKREVVVGHAKVRGSWNRRLRVVAEVEHFHRESNPRFIVTSLAARIGRHNLCTKIFTVRTSTPGIASGTVRIVRPPRERGHHARQSIPAVSVGKSLRVGETDLTNRVPI
jgi:hypothetical protein